MQTAAIDGTRTTILGVQYTHLRLPGGDDLYLTEYGTPFARHLMPDKFWTDKEWFRNHSTKLFGHGRQSGTSTVYRIQTKPVNGSTKDIVMKWNRMGQDVPGSKTAEDMADAEFNSPYEEFSLVMELRGHREGFPKRILTHKPLAIYVPARKVELSRTGRKEDRIKRKILSHRGVSLDMFRSYAVIYEWIKGIDLVEAAERNIIPKGTMANITLLAERQMRVRGFLVRDRKPNHIIVRPNADGDLLQNRNGAVVYAMVDFELLERTPEREAQMQKTKRRAYLEGQANRFEPKDSPDLPGHLETINILGVDYVCGIAESTGGRLWVVGRDPDLFDYFLPERWRGTPRMKLSAVDEVYETVTKDNIHLVWKISRVGEKPDADPFKEDERHILEHGYNSPFEEVALATELSSNGMLSTYPRAIYMTGTRTEMSPDLFDGSRYETHAELRLADGSPILQEDRGYVIVWGYWNKPDEALAEADSDHYDAIDALRALRKGLLTREVYFKIMSKTRQRLAECGVEDLNLRGNHKLLSLDSSRKFVLDEGGIPEVRICNFEFFRRMPQ